MNNGDVAVFCESTFLLKARLAEWLETGTLATLLPEVYALRGVRQSPEFHPEGDAYEHTLLAVQSIGVHEDQRVFWAVLLHDIGKLETTEFVSGRWRSHGHAAAGVRRVPTIMARLGCEHLSDDVAWLVKHHHYRHSWNAVPGAPLTLRQQRFMRHPLYDLLQRVCRADTLGKQTPVCLM